jgi:hypothetical protein
MDTRGPDSKCTDGTQAEMSFENMRARNQSEEEKTRNTSRINNPEGNKTEKKYNYDIYMYKCTKNKEQDVCMVSVVLRLLHGRDRGSALSLQAMVARRLCCGSSNGKRV